VSGKGGNEKQAQATSDLNFPKKVVAYHVNFEGNFGINHVTPRGLKSNLVNQMVTVQGIVTKMSLVQPKISTSVHYCEATKRGSIKEYNDLANLQQLGASNGMMSEGNNAFRMSDDNGNPLTTEYGFCVYRDYQTITI
jgi:DNA replication licensing factor MCM3